MMRGLKRFVAMALVLAILALGAAAEGVVADGDYVPDDFTFSGGSGRVTISCPRVTVSGGQAVATLVFSSPNYPKASVDGVAYDAEHGDGTSIFRVPVALNAECEVVGTTTAMSQPHDVAYTVCVYLSAGAAAYEASAESVADAADEEDDEPLPVREPSALDGRERALPGLTWTSELPLKYAHEFAVDYYEGGYKLLTIGDGNRYLVVPEGGEVPGELDGEIRIIRQPLTCVYLAATAAMALFDAVDGLYAIRLSGTQASGWTIEHAAQAMERGDMRYAGKYSAPDYELMLGEGCDLAIESTMILHTPKVQEMIEQLGIPVFIEHSSYETHPLGRTEWVKLYAALLNLEDKAEAFFDEQAAVLDALKDFPNTEKRVAFFYVSSDGSVVVRGANDYVAGMIELAGGRYVTGGETERQSGKSAVSISMEQFYDVAVNADYLIYNASIDAPLNGVGDLLAKSPLFADFKAVREGNVWSTDKSLYQATDIVASLITDIHAMLMGETEGMRFIRRVE